MIQYSDESDVLSQASGIYESGNAYSGYISGSVFSDYFSSKYQKSIFFHFKCFLLASNSHWELGFLERVKEENKSLKQENESLKQENQSLKQGKLVKQENRIVKPCQRDTSSIMLQKVLGFVNNLLP